MSDTAYRIGLIGEHIGTSHSPGIHRAEAAAHGLSNFRYELIDLADRAVTGDQLGQVLKEHITAGYTGFSVTHPHKQSIVACLDGLSDAARRLGAVNNVVYQAGSWIGHNTDHSGFLTGLHRMLDPNAARDVAVLFGAGGAGAAVASALVEYGVRHLNIIDTDAGQCQRLADLLTPTLPAGVVLETGGPEMAGEWVPAADAVINATPIGMEHLPGAPFDTGLLQARHWVADVIYRPVQTKLLTSAQDLGCTTVYGTAMLVEQAADTFELQTGMTANRQRMRQQLTDTLAAPSNSSLHC